MLNALLKFVISAAALYLVTRLYGGVSFEPGSTWISVLIAALVMGVVNAVLRPILLLLSLPINVLTLGLFTLVVNALMLMLVASLTALNVSGFGGAFVGAIILTVLNWLIDLVLPQELDR
ncbi:phage holin family protein [Deinococcus rubellus]|uniref:Phage holin family protein n=1 Tax=Deinococcus rubellus TaxID=1889240 RepID=A0ABY5YDP2_9DEIO|nr:phage holin family protein [Deinococcus rubellus]UWX62965.1 phage holin family protein [Deinococcus rubellus]